jgi:hypothetical protein
MELYSHERTPGVSYARIGYHYAFPGLRDDHLPITTEDVRSLELPSNWQPASRMGANRATFYQTESILQKQPKNSCLFNNNLWAGGKLFLWQPQNQETLKLKLNITESGHYIIHVVAALTPASGQWYATLAGKPIGLGDANSPINLHVPFRTLSRNFSSKPIELKKGSNTLTINNVSQSPEAQLGFDFFWIQQR